MLHQKRKPRYYYDSDDMGAICLICRREINYVRDIGTCKKCSEDTANKRDQEIDDLKSKVAFLRFWSPPEDDDAHHDSTSSALFFPDVTLVSFSSDDSPSLTPDPVLAHKAILANRSPVFKAMLENEMEESKTGTIKIIDASNDAIRAFVNYMYTAEALVDEKMGCALLVLAEKYMVKHLKEYCEKFLSSKLYWENSLKSYAFAHQHNAKQLLQSALAIILENMAKLNQMEEYKELVEKDPRLLVDIYEAYITKLLRE